MFLQEANKYFYLRCPVVSFSCIGVYGSSTRVCPYSAQHYIIHIGLRRQAVTQYNPWFIVIAACSVCLSELNSKACTVFHVGVSHRTVIYICCVPTMHSARCNNIQPLVQLLQLFLQQRSVTVTCQLIRRRILVVHYAAK
jgi:hypothetical protein